MLENARFRARRIFVAHEKLGAISSSRCQKTRVRGHDDAQRELSYFRTSRYIADWWSQTGSNRRPPACKAGALPTELWPRTEERKEGHARRIVADLLALKR